MLASLAKNELHSLFSERSERKGVLLCVLEFYIWFPIFIKSRRRSDVFDT
ncbi:MAG: hypothetical protein U5L45_01825 [Saprospiraceae bacterium]|nr:hypothetical protein [Saprospiraceae bacterium]